jgi:hypothetical protein
MLAADTCKINKNNKNNKLKSIVQRQLITNALLVSTTPVIKFFRSC